jgi:hypothetical protein
MPVNGNLKTGTVCFWNHRGNFGWIEVPDGDRDV